MTPFQTACQLYDQGLTQRQVADQIYGGNYNSAHGAHTRWKALRQTTPPVVIASHPQTTAREFVFKHGRTFGVEIEGYNVTKTKLANALTAKGIETIHEDYNHATRTHWKLVSDSSVQGNAGFELVSPVLKAEAGLIDLYKVCKVLEEQKAKVNKSCGLHIHVYAGDFTIQNFRDLIYNYAKFEQEINQMMPESRRNNTFCESILKGRTLEQLTEILERCEDLHQIQHKLFGASNTERRPRDGARFHKINTQCFWAYKTVEFRQHNGTTDFNKISNWTAFCLRMVEFTKAHGKADNLADFLTPELIIYFETRKIDHA